MKNLPPLPDDAQAILRAFEQKTRLFELHYQIKERADGEFLIIFIGNPTERFFRILQEVMDAAAPTNTFRERVTLQKQVGAQDSWLKRPEARLLQQVLSESLNVDQHTFGDDFFSRYIPSVVGAETQIVTSGNHIVFGRRGSGKSSLLAYAMRKLEEQRRPYAWVAMQPYERRSDPNIIAEILLEILGQVESTGELALQEELKKKLEVLAGDQEHGVSNQIRLLVPRIKRLFSSVTKKHDSFTIFLDDFHVIDPTIQPEVLSALYAFSRGNKISLKVSAIENFTRMWDPSTRSGLEPSHDVQVLRLDYNLADPERSREHIASILEAHAHYCGLPSLSVLCSKEAILRLVWVAAGVPRDAINIFSQAMARAFNKSGREITVTSINTAASEAADDKMRFVEMDSSGRHEDALDTLEYIKDFCIRQQKQNAFLVKINNDDPFFENVKRLIDLRFLHVLNPGITPYEAGVRWMALLLDYGFYTGIRAARIQLFQREGQTPEVKELRKLPRLQPRTVKAAE